MTKNEAMQQALGVLKQMHLALSCLGYQNMTPEYHQTIAALEATLAKKRYVGRRANATEVAYIRDLYAQGIKWSGYRDLMGARLFMSKPTYMRIVNRVGAYGEAQ